MVALAMVKVRHEQVPCPRCRGSTQLASSCRQCSGTGEVAIGRDSSCVHDWGFDSTITQSETQRGVDWLVCRVCGQRRIHRWLQSV